MNIITAAAAALATIAPIVLHDLEEQIGLQQSYVVDLKINQIADGADRPIAAPQLIVPAGQRGQVTIEANDELLVEIRLKMGRNVDSTQHRAKFSLSRPDDEDGQLLAEPELLVKTGQRGQVVLADDSGDTYSCEILVHKPSALHLR